MYVIIHIPMSSHLACKECVCFSVMLLFYVFVFVFFFCYCRTELESQLGSNPSDAYHVNVQRFSQSDYA